MNSFSWFLIITMMISTSALGQTVYKCSNPDGKLTFSQQPCTPTGGETISINKPAAGYVSDAYIRHENELGAICLSHVRGFLKDPDSAKIEGTPVTGISTKTGEVRKSVRISVNARNSYGGYSGAETVECVLGMDEKTVLTATMGGRKLF